MKYPCGEGPNEYAYLMLKAGVPLFDHPITPFEDLVICCAAICGDPVLEVVRGMQVLSRRGAGILARLDQSSDLAMGLFLRCLDWIEARLRSGQWP